MTTVVFKEFWKSTVWDDDDGGGDEMMMMMMAAVVIKIMMPFTNI